MCTFNHIDTAEMIQHETEIFSRKIIMSGAMQDHQQLLLTLLLRAVKIQMLFRTRTAS